MAKKPQNSDDLSSSTKISKRIEIDWIAVGKLAEILCTPDEIAGICYCSVDTLERRCKEEHDMTLGQYLKPFKSFGKASLRRVQMKVAMRGDTTMLRHLGKFELDQNEKLIEPEKVERKPLTLNYKLRD